MTDEVITPIADSMHSIIGEGTRFRGEFEVRGLLRIDGDFMGKIVTDGKVLVSKNGRADCDIHGSIVVIGGILRGTILASTSVEILSSAIVIGTIVTPRLIVHEDVVFHGACRVTREPALLPEPKTGTDQAQATLDYQPGNGQRATTHVFPEKVPEQVAP